MANMSVSKSVVVFRDFGLLRRRLKSVSRHLASETYMCCLNSPVSGVNMGDSLYSSEDARYRI
jgi:hypothetical protein